MEEKDFQKQIETLFFSLCPLLKQCLACFSMKVHNSVTLISYFHRYQQDRSLIMFFFFFFILAGGALILIIPISGKLNRQKLRQRWIKGGGAAHYITLKKKILPMP